MTFWKFFMMWCVIYIGYNIVMLFVSPTVWNWVGLGLYIPMLGLSIRRIKWDKKRNEKLIAERTAFLKARRNEEGSR